MPAAGRGGWGDFMSSSRAGPQAYRQRPFCGRIGLRGVVGARRRPQKQGEGWSEASGQDTRRRPAEDGLPKEEERTTYWQPYAAATKRVSGLAAHSIRVLLEPLAAHALTRRFTCERFSSLHLAQN